MQFADSFSYLNATIYGVNINANLDMRLEVIHGFPGAARVYFTDSAVNFYKLYFILNCTKFKFNFVILSIAPAQYEQPGTTPTSNHDSR